MRLTTILIDSPLNRKAQPKEANMSNEQREYWNDVRDTSAGVIADIRGGAYGDSPDVYDVMHEVIDGSARVIYTHQAQQCLIYSPNDGIGIEDGLTNGLDEGGGINYPALAFAAFMADVQEAMHKEGFDFSEPFPCPDSECGLAWETRDEATECCKIGNCPACGETSDADDWSELAWVVPSDGAMHKTQGSAPYDPTSPGVWQVAECCEDCSETGPGNGAVAWEAL